MKTKSLQFGKAMSAALFVLLLNVAGMKNALAQNQVATLQHGEDISVFYGNNAFVEAHTAAVDGDIITLSSGNFIKTDITKAITLRGAGYVTDTVAGSLPTIITGDLTISISNDTAFLSLEGIYFLGKVRYHILSNPVFSKCAFYEFTYAQANSSMMNFAQFVNCLFLKRSGSVSDHFFNFTSGTSFINCVVYGMRSNVAPLQAYNSIIYVGGSSQDALSAYNCIIINNCDSHHVSYLSGNSIAYNCIGITLGYSPVFNGNTTFNCQTYSSYSQVFETFTGGFSLYDTYFLKDEIATGFLGSDGTQVGIYGGFMPYSNRPSYMVLKRCNVANRSTIDGKLSVDIEVVAEEE